MLIKKGPDQSEWIILRLAFRNGFFCIYVDGPLKLIVSHANKMEHLTKDLLEQLTSTFFPWVPQFAKSQTWSNMQAQEDCSMRMDKASLSACNDVEPSLRYISPAPGWRITSHSLLFYFFLFLSLLCVCAFTAHPHSHA